MQIFKTLSLIAFLSLGLAPTELSAQANTAVTAAETPAKTVILKHPLAENSDNFFSSGTAFMFEIYKAGNIAEITELIKKDNNVTECSAGGVNGDYCQITIVLKSQKDKKWFGQLFKKAGLAKIKINNNALVAVEKM